jgi:nitrite reductase/ring-hydroxylating ferredoxin subunit
VKVAGTEIGIYNVGGQLHAVRNVCADQGGPLCQGEVFDRIEADFNQDHTLHEYIKEQGALVACPWHGWEYDLVTGRCLWNPRFRVRVYPVEIASDGTVKVMM